MKPEDLFAPVQLEPHWRWEFGVIVDLRSEGLGISFVSSHYTRSDAHLAAADVAAHHLGAPVFVARRKVLREPWDEVEHWLGPAAHPQTKESAEVSQ